MLKFSVNDLEDLKYLGIFSPFLIFYSNFTTQELQSYIKLFLLLIQTHPILDFRNSNSPGKLQFDNINSIVKEKRYSF